MYQKIQKVHWDGVLLLFRDGIRLFLLYLYEKPLPSKAAAYIASYIGFFDTKDRKNRMQLCLVITETTMAK